ncbi:hypothetical protein B0F90DRAFT_473378 [Multifurca ochricompacta]|uniref:Uncharacterized protein n=1 Tax=Multifurca ochricompacta TaxID=376703 RepID=A0AAD4MAH5_9AGAM|nr:hypothetical protein B0F90DRAFT_473378 [Multifurca ochricompacta]
MRERIAEGASGTARESKNPGTRVAKSSISLSSSRAVRVQVRAFASTIHGASVALSSTLRRKPSESHFRCLEIWPSSVSLHWISPRKGPVSRRRAGLYSDKGLVNETFDLPDKRKDDEYDNLRYTPSEFGEWGAIRAIEEQARQRSQYQIRKGKCRDVTKDAEGDGLVDRVKEVDEAGEEEEDGMWRSVGIASTARDIPNPLIPWNMYAAYGRACVGRRGVGRVPNTAEPIAASMSRRVRRLN